jgi:riboflavin kinase/FMN adenylyltransferase
MRVVRWPGGEAPCPRASVATLGVFDGVHRGHAEILAAVRQQARARSCRSVVVTFDRHPGAVVRHAPQPAITSLNHKLRLFDSLGLDLCVVIRFDTDVAAMPAEDFARAVFVELVGARLLVLGGDCRFGRNREGDVAACRRFGEQMGYDVLVVPPVAVGGERVSSTAIRQAILDGALDRAAELLGRPFSLYGTVVRGDGRGRSLGYPTANLDPHNETIPPDGVYAAWATFGNDVASAVVSVGRRETFAARTHGGRVVEVHLMERAQDLYGCDMEVELVRFLRPQRAFARADELVTQVAADLREARTVLAGSARPQAGRQA